ncbi:Shikimate kinase 1 [Anaerobiospirillum thomasii]|uniref:Shikimate kinase n=1 Tax=Anaerobiospirillum thomasii TaxID=179995 RepID=A0A2X0VQ91_9GAMM|nr:shikimate kinase [Anaerobiospirillum thomasii]SPT69698.1 Shikimate kinase 1 [Anaerobiospirillum thomasii]SPT71748.1 Shikimate kinase 1 [Anaerobiospirillum thomasii]SPT78908.1 Shikimate kinase 1 [Anaerobiospirillum thomasii]
MASVTGPIVLIGPMGCGKSTVGRALSDSLGYDFIDLDSLIEKSLSMSINDMFKIYGESYFRCKEREFLSDCLKCSKAVIATGGGAIMDAKNREAMVKDSICIYLYASVETQYARTAHDNNRPMIAVDDRKGRLSELFAIRDPLYSSISSFKIETDNLDVNEITRLILDKLQG